MTPTSPIGVLEVIYEVLEPVPRPLPTTWEVPEKKDEGVSQNWPSENYREREKCNANTW